MISVIYSAATYVDMFTTAFFFENMRLKISIRSSLHFEDVTV
jgi:hypothetical protein